ncbi:hypothetical protein BV898_09179 [Hypsibius exemplaris]|uniref:MYND-type domain-containing protein n=1 Tax=Hypsibius exemplaris TaxID=2072580 RepID=A0A1W0WN94_HYPEX|nr:hypothetical protein BV898_09179 [Hypsibius exemplaris]
MHRFVWESSSDDTRKEFCYRCAVDAPDSAKLQRCSNCKWAYHCSKECQKRRPKATSIAWRSTATSSANSPVCPLSQPTKTLFSVTSTKPVRWSCQANAIAQDGGIGSYVRACTDPEVEAERTALRCQNVCYCEPIPNNKRAKQPCPVCGEVNKSRWKATQPLLARIDEMYLPPVEQTFDRHLQLTGSMASFRAIILETERLLHHDKNILLYANKYGQLTRTLYGRIIVHHLEKGDPVRALPLVKEMRQRCAVHPGAGTDTVLPYERIYQNPTSKQRPTIDHTLLRHITR